jgi:hypothetical protein
MNKQIEKLIDDAKLTAVCEMFENELVEFAKLIIKECTDICYENEYMTPNQCAWKIQSNFGV